MKKISLNRRQMMKIGATTSLSLVAGQAALQTTLAKSEMPETPNHTIGIATFGFTGLSNAQLAEELAASGFKMIQLFLSQKDSNYWRYNSRSDLSDMTPERCREIAKIYRSNGITIHSIGVYTNLIHPEESERNANLAYFEAMMKVAKNMGVSTLITEAGHYHPEKPTSDFYHFQADVWKLMVATGKQLAEMAKRYQATVLIEPSFQSFFASAKRTRLFLEEVNSPHLRALLDPANLLEVNDLEEMFTQLSPWIDCLHAKDRQLHTPHGVAAGKGDLDYPKFLELAAKHTPHAPLILEYVGPDSYKDALKHLLKTINA